MNLKTFLTEKKILSPTIFIVISLGISASIIFSRIPNIMFGKYNFIVKAIIHILLYFTMSLFFTALLKRKNIWIIVIPTFISTLDEVLQNFNSSRSASIIDWLFNFFGILIASLVIFYRNYRASKIKLGRFKT